MGTRERAGAVGVSFSGERDREALFCFRGRGRQYAADGRTQRLLQRGGAAEILFRGSGVAGRHADAHAPALPVRSPVPEADRGLGALGRCLRHRGREDHRGPVRGRRDGRRLPAGGRARGGHLLPRGQPRAAHDRGGDLQRGRQRRLRAGGDPALARALHVRRPQPVDLPCEVREEKGSRRRPRSCSGRPKP